MPISSGDVSPEAGLPETHEAILQLLDRQVGDDYFPKEPFQGSVDAWNGIPIVYASEHPDLEAFEKNPEAELARIRETTGKRAEIVGKIANARIETTGHAKLMGSMVFDSDPEVSQLIEAGKLSHSTGFWCQTDGNTLKGSVLPNHLLIFEENALNQPRDRGAVILNKVNTELKAFTNEGRVMSGKNLSKFQSIMDSLTSFFNEITGGQVEASPPDEEEKPVTNLEPEPEKPVTNMTEDIIASKDAEIASLKEQNEAITNKVSELEKQLADINAASKEAAWGQMKNKLPPGLVRTPEKEAETRQLFESDPYAFTNLLLDSKRKEQKKEQGQQFVNMDDNGTPVITRRAIPGTLH